MPSIVIKEIDATTAGNAAVETDIVFIPGFMNTNFDNTDYWDDDKTRTPAKAKVPTLCTSIAQFERCFGKQPAKLMDVTDNLKYSEIITSGYTTTGKEETQDAKEGTIPETLVISKSITEGAYAHPSLTESEYTVELEAGVKTITLPVQVVKGSYIVDDDLVEGTGVTSYDVKIKYGGNTVYANTGKDGSTIKLATAPVTEGYVECVVSYFGASSTVKLTAIKEVVENDEVISSSRTAYYVSGVSGEDTYTIDLTGVEFSDYTKYEVSYYVGATTVEGTAIFAGKIGAENEAFKDEFDPSYIYAKELLTLGLPVLYCSYNTEDDGVEPKASTLYGWLIDDDEGAFSTIADRGMYDVKYITSGGYPVFESEPAIYTKMKSLAVNRGDCVALIDHINAPNVPLLGDESFYGRIVKTFTGDVDGDKCAAFTPWVNIKGTAVTGTHTLPPSFAYLSALAVSIRTNASWLAVAGATRGAIPNLDADAPLNINKVLTNSIAEEGYQNRIGVSINAITNIQPYGYRIWGNRTLKTNTENLVATSFLNVRNLVSEVKKVTYRACRKYMFEQNNDILWTNFKAAIEPTLEQMRTGAGISGYKIIKETTNEKAKLVATIKLYPIYAVEDFEITVRMEDDEIALS